MNGSDRKKHGTVRDMRDKIKERNYQESLKCITDTLINYRSVPYNEVAERVISNLKAAGYSIRRFKARS